MDEFGALLHKPWIAGATGEDIVGYWAEDDSAFAIKVPHQLRDVLVSLQQKLSARYLELERRRRELSALESNAAALLI